MFKRPLIPAAMCVCLFSAFVVFVFPHLIYPEYPYETGQSVTVSGTISSIEDKSWSEYVYLVSGGKTYLLTVTDDLSRLYSPGIGNHITAECEFAGFNKARNRGNFDEETYFRSLGVYQKLKLKKIQYNDRKTNVVSGFLLEAKRFIKMKIASEMSDAGSGSGVITALLTGDRSEVDDDTYELYQTSGIAHILAISGLHISFIGMSIYRMLRKLFRHTSASIISMGLTLLFCIMCGGSSSAIRALIMLVVRLGAVSMGRRYDMISSLCLAGILLLLKNPFYLTNSAFILSFAAIGGLAVIAYPAAGLTEQIFKLKNGIVKRVTQAFISSFCVTITVLPVILSMYFEFPLYAPLVNVCVLPLMSFVLSGAFAGAFSSLISPVFSGLCFSAAVFFLNMFSGICNLINRLPGASIVTGRPSDFQIIIYYVVLAAASFVIIWLNRNWKNLKKRITAGQWSRYRIIYAASLCITGVILVLTVSLKAHINGLYVRFIDVGQGECIVIRDESGTVYMIDAGTTGTSSVYRNRIRSNLKYSGISKIDCVIVTHPDLDHMSGVTEMLEELEKPGHIGLGRLLIPDVTGNSNYDKLTTLAQKQNVDVVSIYTGMELLSGRVRLLCIHPDKDYITDDTNNMSAVMIMESGELSAVFTGDISSDIEKNLVIPECTLLDVAHHGSKYSSSEEFLAMVNPRIAVVSAGRNNIYGHPAPETLERLDGVGADILCTAEKGEIEIHADHNGSIKITTMFP